MAQPVGAPPGYYGGQQPMMAQPQPMYTTGGQPMYATGAPGQPVMYGAPGQQPVMYAQPVDAQGQPQMVAVPTTQ